MATKPSAEQRRAKRYHINVPATVRVANGGVQEISTETRDISRNGVFFYADADLAAGSEIEIVAMLPPEITQGDSAWVCCHARVVRVEPGGPDGSRGIAAVIERVGVLPQA